MMMSALTAPSCFNLANLQVLLPIVPGGVWQVTLGPVIGADGRLCFLQLSSSEPLPTSVVIPSLCAFHSGF